MAGDLAGKPLTRSSPTSNVPRIVSPALHSANIMNVGMSGSGGLKVLNSGWQVWSGAGSPSPQRKPLASPASSGHELLPETAGHRGSNLSDAWPSPQPPNTWDDVNTPDVLQLQESQAQLNLHASRQRSLQPTAAFSGPRTDDRSSSKSLVFSPQRALDTSAPRVPASSSQASVYGAGALGLPHINNPLYASVPEDLSVSLRGMAVEDDFAVHPPLQTLTTSPRPPAGVHPPRQPFGPYPQDYPTYYTNPPASDFPYSYDVYNRPPINPPVFLQTPTAAPGPGGLFPSVGISNLSTVPVPPPQSTMFFDSRPPTTPFFFPSSSIIYPPTPMVPQQIPPHIIGDKKNEIYNPQSSQQNLMYHAPPPVHQPYNVMLGGGLYGPSTVPLYVPQGRQPANIPTPTGRSRLLDDFRANRSKKWELKDVWGYVVEFSKDQHGSRFIQQKIETATPEDRQRVFEEIVPNHTLYLMEDVFGNYVIQKLFEHGTQAQKNVLTAAMEGSVMRLSLQMYGCRVVQKALEHVPPEQQVAIAREIEPYVLDCVKDANGNHVVQKLIERVPVDRLNFIGGFRSHVLELGSDAYGCRVLQRCFEFFPEEYSRPLLDEVHNHTLKLMQNQFGNYVMQYLLEHGKPQDRALLISKMRGHLMQLAKDRFASNVCEKALKFSDSETRHGLIDTLLKPQENSSGPVIFMLKDQYANYVLQTALDVAEGEQREALFNKVKIQLAGMRRFGVPYSRQLSSVEKKIMELNSSSRAK